MAATRNCVTHDLVAPPHIARLLEALADPKPDDVVGSTSDLVFDDDGASSRGQLYTVLIGALPFSGSIAAKTASAAARSIGSRRSELVALAASLQALKPGGRAALVVPESALEGSTRGHRCVRRMLIEDYGLQAVIALRAGLLKPRTRAAILLFVRGGETKSIWFDELQSVAAIPELLDRWKARERTQANSAPGHGFRLVRDAVSAPDYALGIARARAAHAARATAPTPEQLLHEIASLEADILQGIRDLVGLLK